MLNSLLAITIPKKPTAIEPIAVKPTTEEPDIVVVATFGTAQHIVVIDFRPFVIVRYLPLKAS